MTVTDEDKKIIDEVLFPYWKGKDFTPNFIKALPPETRHLFWGSDPENVGTKFSFVIISTSTMRHSQNWVLDYEKMLTRGCKGLREEAQARLDALDDPRDLAFKRPFYEAAVITCDALSLFAKRYSKLAAEMAAKTEDPRRKKELEEISAICACGTIFDRPSEQSSQVSPGCGVASRRSTSASASTKIPRASRPS